MRYFAIFLFATMLGAQTVGLRLGTALSQPQNIAGYSFAPATALSIGVQVSPTRNLRLEAVSQTTMKSTESSGFAYSWDYEALGASYVMGLSHRVVLGAQYRWETYAAPMTDGKNTHASAHRLWLRAGYEKAWEPSAGMEICWDFTFSAAQKDRYNEDREYSTAEALRLLAPSYEISTGITFRF